jgi:hypothetical protein
MPFMWDGRNDKDCYVLAVEKKDTVLGHLPHKISCVCSLSLRRGGSIECRVTGKRRYSSDLPEGLLTFTNYKWLIFIVENIRCIFFVVCLIHESILTAKFSWSMICVSFWRFISLLISQSNSLSLTSLKGNWHQKTSCAQNVGIYVKVSQVMIMSYSSLN